MAKQVSNVIQPHNHALPHHPCFCRAGRPGAGTLPSGVHTLVKSRWIRSLPYDMLRQPQPYHNSIPPTFMIYKHFHPRPYKTSWQQPRF
jgi:hypothetical protein